MRPGLIVGGIISLALHAGLGFGGELFKPVKKPVRKEVIPMIELVEMPRPEPDEPEPSEAGSDEPLNPSDFAPPSIADNVGIVQIDSFVQQIQPPPPPSLGRPGAITIPQHHGGPISGKILGTVFDLKNLDQIPVAKFQAQPVYPFELKRAGITGQVSVAFIVDSNGEVQGAYVISSTMREFESPAINAINKWKFRAGRKAGKAVNTSMVQPFTFSITTETE